MNFSHTLVFEIAAEWGHFRTFNTTSSPLTYPIPPRTALIGLVGAVLGIERENSTKAVDKEKSLAYLLRPEQLQLAVQLVKPVKKQVIGFNLLETKNMASYYNISTRTQVAYELLKNVHYRIFAVFAEPELQTELSERLQAKKYYYQPYLGLSQFLADVRYTSTDRLEPLKQQKVHQVHTVVNLSRLNNAASAPLIELQSGTRYSSDIYPYALDHQRVVQQHAEILVAAEPGRSVGVQYEQLWQHPTYGNICFL